MMDYRKKLFYIFSALILITCACIPDIHISIGATQTPFIITFTPEDTVEPTLTPPEPPTAEAPADQPEGLDRVKVYLVAVGDNGTSGTLIGCGDSLVPVEVPIPPTKGVLRAALTELFKLEGQQYYGQSGLYNALYLSNLTIDDLAVTDGEAIIHLSGNLVFGGECDIPRIEEQLKAVAFQFSTVDRVSIFVNGKPLEKLLDLRG